MHKIIIVLLIVSALSHVLRASPLHSQEFQDNETEYNNEVSLTGEEEFDETRSAEYPDGFVEEIKSRILKSLHKTEAPKNHVPLPVLQKLNFRNASVENRTANETNSNTNGKTQTNFLPAHVDNTCHDNSGLPCIKFHFNIPPQDDFKSAELWLNKKEGVTEFSIANNLSFDEKEENGQSTTYVYNQTFSNGWIRFDVSHLISSAYMTNLEFIVSAENSEAPFETEGDTKPFLILHTVSDIRSVSKRSSFCSNDSTTCCREKYIIKFSDIKWDTWIVEPESYEANYCKGTCTVNLSNTHHSRVFMALCENNPQKFKETGKTECLTCAPTVYRPISVIYLDDDGVHIYQDLPGMSVTDCGCV